MMFWNNDKQYGVKTRIIIDNEEKTQSEWTNILIGLCENYLAEDDTDETDELEVRIWEIWSKISWHMWW